MYVVTPFAISMLP